MRDVNLDPESAFKNFALDLLRIAGCHRLIDFWRGDWSCVIIMCCDFRILIVACILHTKCFASVRLPGHVIVASRSYWRGRFVKKTVVYVEVLVLCGVLKLIWFLICFVALSCVCWWTLYSSMKTLFSSKTIFGVFWNIASGDNDWWRRFQILCAYMFLLHRLCGTKVVTRILQVSCHPPTPVVKHKL